MRRPSRASVPTREATFYVTRGTLRVRTHETVVGDPVLFVGVEGNAKGWQGTGQIYTDLAFEADRQQLRAFAQSIIEGLDAYEATAA